MQFSRSIIAIIKKNLDDFWRTFYVLFNGSNGITFWLLGFQIIAKNMKIFQKISFFVTFWELSPSIIHIIKKTLDDFWSIFDVLFNGFNGITFWLLTFQIIAKKNMKISQKISFSHFLGVIFQKFQNIFNGSESIL